MDSRYIFITMTWILIFCGQSSTHSMKLSCLLCPSAPTPSPACKKKSAPDNCWILQRTGALGGGGQEWGGRGKIAKSNQLFHEQTAQDTWKLETLNRYSLTSQSPEPHVRVHTRAHREVTKSESLNTPGLNCAPQLGCSFYITY